MCTYIYISYTHTVKYYSAIKMNEILPFVTMWMDLEDIMLSEVNQAENDKHHVISYSSTK